MRNTKMHSLLLALLCTAALFTFACNRGEEEDRTGQVTNDAQPQAAQNGTPATPEPQTNELRPEPQTVDIQEGVPPETSQESADLRARERELAARQADLDAREQRLRERERQSRAAPRRETPRPAPAPRREPEERRTETAQAPRPAPAPAPAPKPTREEPAREETRREEPARTPEPAREEEQPRALTTTVTVPAGTVMDVEFTETLASNANSPGETFRVRVAQDVTEDGEVAIPAGSEILGEVTEAVPLRKRVGGQARLTLKFTDLVLPSGATVPIDASFVQQGRNETRKDAATIGGGAAAGAVLGRVLNKGNRSKGAVIGAIIGAAAGAAIASKTPGEEVVIPEGSVVSLKLDDSVEVKVKSRR
ncbi:MAG TPA: glycine zipper domain-containing protein [Thermoanaerobaculia bacterium]|jgi:type IV secretory pathway VirB10-like protein